MIEIKTKPYITVDDIEKLTGKHWTKFEFFQMMENDSYVSLFCNNDAIELLDEEIEWEYGKGTPRYERLENQKALVLTLRDVYGIEDEILVYLSW